MPTQTHPKWTSVSYGRTLVRTTLSPGWAGPEHLESNSFGGRTRDEQTPDGGTQAGDALSSVPSPEVSTSPRLLHPKAYRVTLRNLKPSSPKWNSTFSPPHLPLQQDFPAPGVVPPHPCWQARSLRESSSRPLFPAPPASTPSASPADSASSSVPPTAATASRQDDHSSFLNGPSFQTLLLPHSGQGALLKMQICPCQVRNQMPVQVKPSV